MTKYQINGKTLEMLGYKIEFDFPIDKVELYEETILVLLNSDSNLRKWRQFPNLYCVDFKGKVLWIAELPTTDAGDPYHSFSIIDKAIKAYFDVLQYIASDFANKLLLTRERRVVEAQSKIFAFLNNKQKEFIEFVLSHYIEIGVEELDIGKIIQSFKA
ncbi:MAG: hypothetical protein K2Q34_00610 [Alphaproteobacteria bacterium]|nr:hypothetical protein [Alphaproteobacteria bacterium]